MSTKEFVPFHARAAAFMARISVVHILKLAVLPAFFILFTISTCAQESPAPVSLLAPEWQRIHEGLKKALPTPEPENALRLETPTHGGNLVQFDLTTLEKNELAASVAAPSSGNHLDGRSGLAPRSIGGNLQIPLQEPSPEGFGLAGAASNSKIVPMIPAPYLTPYGVPFSTQLRLLARFSVDGADFYYTCSASQASDFHLLTAAHCVYNHDPKGDGSGAGAGFAAEVWAFPAVTDVVDPVDSDWPDFPYGIAKVAFESTYDAWINTGDLNWDIAFLTLDRPLGDHVGWMGREWGIKTNSLNFDGYPTGAPLSSDNPFQFPGYEANNVLGYTCCRIEMNALIYGGEAGGGVWRLDPSGLASMVGVNSTSDRAGNAEATLLTGQMEADFEAIVARDRAAHSPADLPQIIEYVGDDDSKGLVDTSVAPGGSFHLKLNAFNAGYASAGDAIASVYLTKDPNNVASGTFLQDLDLGDLDAYSYIVQTQEVKVPATVTPGSYYVGYLLSAANPQYGTDRNDVVIAKQPLSVTQASLASFTVNPTAVIEQQSATGTVTLTGPAPATGVTIDLSTTQADVVHVPSTVEVPPGALSATFPITTSYSHCAVYALITASGAGSGQVAHFAVNAYPYPPVAVIFSPSSVTGGNSSTGRVILQDFAPYGGEDIELQSSDPSIQVPAEIHIPTGANSAYFTAQTTPEEKAVQGIIGAFDQIGRGVKGFLDALPPVIFKLTVNPPAVVRGSVSMGTVTLTGKAPAKGTTVTLTINKGDPATFDDKSMQITITIPVGQDKADFKIRTTTVDATKTVTITASGPGGPKATTLTVVPGLTADSVVIDPHMVVGGAPNTTTGTVNLNAAAPADTTIKLKSGNTDFATVDDSVTVKAGKSSATFTITAPKVVTDSKTVMITATREDDKGKPLSSASANVQVVKLIPASVKTIRAGLTGGQRTLATFTLNGKAPQTGINVQVASDKPLGLVTFTDKDGNPLNGGAVPVAGTNTGFFFITADPTKSKALTEPVTLTISVVYNGGTATTKVIISPVGVTGFTINPASVTGGATSSGTVTLSDKAPTGGIIVNVTSSDPAVPPVKVPIPAGQTSMKFNIPTNPVKTTTDVTLTATYGGFAPKAMLTVFSPDLKSVGVAPATVKGGAKVTVTVMLTGPAPAGGIPVGLKSSDNVHFPIPANTTVVVNANQTSATYTVTTTKVTKNTPVTVTATYNFDEETADLTITK